VGSCVTTGGFAIKAVLKEHSDDCFREGKGAQGWGYAFAEADEIVPCVSICAVGAVGPTFGRGSSSVIRKRQPFGVRLVNRGCSPPSHAVARDASGVEVGGRVTAGVVRGTRGLTPLR
jgi:hypothetical protein